MNTNKKQERDDDFGGWLAQNYGSMSKKDSQAKKPSPAAPKKKTPPKKKDKK